MTFSLTVEVLVSCFHMGSMWEISVSVGCLATPENIFEQTRKTKAMCSSLRSESQPQEGAQIN